MSESVSLPALGESVTEGTVTRWLKNVGDRVEVDEPLLEVSTDKVDTEIPSPVAGVIEAILVQEDETVEVGTALVTIGDGSGGGEAPAAPAAEAAPAEAPGRAAPSLRPLRPRRCSSRGRRHRPLTPRLPPQSLLRRPQRPGRPAEPVAAPAPAEPVAAPAPVAEAPAAPEPLQPSRRRLRRRGTGCARARSGAGTRRARTGAAAPAAAPRRPARTPAPATSPRSFASSPTSRASTCPPSREPVSVAASASRTCSTAGTPRPLRPQRRPPQPPAAARGLAPSRHDAADVAAPQGRRRARRPLHAVVGTAHDRRRGRRHQGRRSPRPGEGRLPGEDGREALVPAVLRPRGGRSAEGVPGHQRDHRRRLDRLPRSREHLASRSTPSAACSPRSIATPATSTSPVSPRRSPTWRSARARTS